MIQSKDKMVAMQLTTDEGAFVCNMVESDIAKIAAKKPGSHVVIRCAIRLDGMSGGRYELYRAKSIETSSIDFYQPFHKKTGVIVTRKKA